MILVIRQSRSETGEKIWRLGQANPGRFALVDCGFALVLQLGHLLLPANIFFKGYARSDFVIKAIKPRQLRPA